jgi:hypothetical protein
MCVRISDLSWHRPHEFDDSIMVPQRFKDKDYVWIAIL